MVVFGSNARATFAAGTFRFDKFTHGPAGSICLVLSRPSRLRAIPKPENGNSQQAARFNNQYYDQARKITCRSNRENNRSTRR